jgi:hypothetical protein
MKNPESRIQNPESRIKKPIMKNSETGVIKRDKRMIDIFIYLNHE